MSDESFFTQSDEHEEEPQVPTHPFSGDEEPAHPTHDPTKLPNGEPNWDMMYRMGIPPWDTGRVAPELECVLKEGVLPQKGAALDIGCGSGANAIRLWEHGYDITAIDISPIALERAHSRAEQKNALNRFVLDDVFRIGPTLGTFDVVYDGGFYHIIRQHKLDKYLDLLWRITKPGSYFFCLAGRSEEEGGKPIEEGGPPTVTEENIYDELGRLFDIVHLRQIMIDSHNNPDGFPAWSCLMYRPVIDLPK